MARSLRGAPVALIVVAALALSGSVHALANPSGTVTSTFSVAGGPCLNNGQICPTAPTPLTSLASSTNVTVELDHNADCSAIALKLFVDGKFAVQTPFAQPGASTTTTVAWPKDFKSHALSYEGVGQVGGCNSGHLFIWTGSVSVTYRPPTCDLGSAPDTADHAAVGTGSGSEAIAGAAAAPRYCTQTTITCRANTWATHPPAYDTCAVEVLAEGTRQPPSGVVALSFSPASSATMFTPSIGVAVPKCTLKPTGVIPSADEATARCTTFALAPKERFPGGTLTVTANYKPSSKTFRKSSGEAELQWPRIPVMSGRVTMTVRFHEALPNELIIKSPATLRLCDAPGSPSAQPYINVPDPAIWNFKASSHQLPIIYGKSNRDQPNCTPPVKFHATVPTLIHIDGGFNFPSLGIIVP
jgi:hypothetical protein